MLPGVQAVIAYLEEKVYHAPEMVGNRERAWQATLALPGGAMGAMLGTLGKHAAPLSPEVANAVRACRAHRMASCAHAQIKMLLALFWSPRYAAGKVRCLAVPRDRQCGARVPHTPHGSRALGRTRTDLDAGCAVPVPVTELEQSVAPQSPDSASAVHPCHPLMTCAFPALAQICAHARSNLLPLLFSCKVSHNPVPFELFLAGC